MTNNERAYRNRQMGAGLVKNQIRDKIEDLDECIKEANRYIRDNISNITENKDEALKYLPGAYENIKDYQEQIVKFEFAKKVLNEVLENK